MVSGLALYSDDPTSDPAKVYNFISVKVACKEQKGTKKRPGLPQ